MIIDAVKPTSSHTDDQPIPSQQHTQPDDDDESVEQDLVDEIMATLQNDECTMHEIQIMHPPDMQHIYHHDVLLQDRLNEDIDLQDAIPKTAHLQNETDAAALTLATVRQIKNKALNIKIHIDGGSNRSVTPSLELLDNITDIPPYHMFGASSDEVALTCTKVGVLRLPCNNHAVLPIRTYYSPQADETIISPGDVTTSPDNPFEVWTQVSNMKTKKGHITFHSDNGRHETQLDTVLKNGLWYTTHPLYDILPGTQNDAPTIRKLSVDAQHELWHQRLGHPGEKVTATISSCVEGVPSFHKCRNHFYMCDSCMKAKITKPPKPSKSITTVNSFGQRFHMDFGFARGSDFKYEDITGRIITSRNGYNAYLSIIDVHTRFQWVYLTASKDPPIAFVEQFLDRYGLKSGQQRNIRTDQGGELWKSTKFRTLALLKGYLLEPTGSDDPAQNGMVENPNKTLGKLTRALLYNAGLGSEYWSYALTHAVYLKNRLPHAAHGFKKTPFECLTGLKPDLSTLKVWGCKLLARKPGKRPAKLDHHTSEGIFLNYTATSKNVVYLDINTGREKIASNVVFDEANFSDGSGSPSAHALHRAGTRTFQSDLDIPTQSEAVHTDTTNNQAFQVHVDHALTIPPFQTVHLTTGVHTQDEQSFCHVEYHIGNPLIQLQHFITINNGKFECFICLTNTTPISILLSAGQRIGTITTANDAFVNISHHDGVTTSPLPTSTPPPTFAPIPHPPTNQARPVSPEPIEEPILRQFSSPIESIIFSTNPHGHQLDITCKIKGDDELLGMELDNYSNYHQLKLLHCKKGTPMARIPKWRSQLRNAIV